MSKRFHVKLRRSSSRIRGKRSLSPHSAHGLNMVLMRKRSLLCRWGSLGAAGLRWRAGPLKRLFLWLRSIGRGRDPLYVELRRIQKLYAQGWEQPWMKVMLTISWLLLLGLLFLNPLSFWSSMRSDAEQLVCPGPSCSILQVD